MTTPTVEPSDTGELLERFSAEAPAPGTTVVVRGMPGSGKTRLLVELYRRMQDRAVLVPHGADGEDSAESLLAAVADSQAIRMREPQLAEQIAQPTTLFEEKVRWAGIALERHSDDLVLLGDAGASWLGKTRDNPDGNARARLFAEMILHSRCGRILTSPINEERLSGETRVFELTPYRLHAEAHVDRDWSVLSEEAHLVADRLQHREVTPFVFRVLVLSELVGLEMLTQRLPARVHVARLFWAMVRSSDDRPRCLAQAWRSLATLRGIADEPLIMNVVEPDDWTRDALLALLVDQDIGAPRLAQLFRWQARRAQKDTHPATVAVHRRAANHYRSVASTLGSHVELIHHLGRALDIEQLRQVTPLFPEQLHDIGWFLSVRLHRHRDAARVYEAAIEHNPADARAHHYRAFNLDVAGLEPSEVRRSYEEALTLQPGVVWWHSRYIRYLIARGQIEEARAAWDVAMDSVVETADPSSPWLYEDLHLDVVRALLARNEFGFAREILDDVPAELLSENGTLAATADYVRRLKDADPSRDYVPIWRLTPDWPEHPPALLPEERDGEPLREWWAGRVYEIDEDDDQAYLLIAKVDAERGEIVEESSLSIETSVLRRHAPDHAELKPGVYVQIGFYGQDEPQPLLVPDTRPADFVDPVLTAFPDPLRYVHEYAREVRRRQLA